MSEFHEVSCPHCNGAIIIYPNELNCRIFRHGVYLANNEPIPPHAPKEECDRLASEGLIYGCGKPFMIQQDMTAVACDYI
jgi:DNA-directed RNA polymerase subunit RPC12/RpoP